MLGRYSCVATVCVLTGCGGAGVLEYTGGVPKAYRAQFAVESCALKSHLKVPAAETKFYLVDGRESYAWLGVDSKYRGVEIENYYQDEHGHHFSVRERRRAWQYHIPDEVGANGVMEYFERDNLKVVKIRDGFSVQGTPTDKCTLTFVGSEDGPTSDSTKPAEPCSAGEPTPSSDPGAEQSASPAASGSEATPSAASEPASEETP